MTNLNRSELLFIAAEECLLHAKESYNRSAWNMAVRRAQEGVELELTAILALVGIHYPKDHDQAPLALRILAANGFDLGDKKQKIQLISLDLSRKRGPALHQEEGYDQATAKKALEDCQYVFAEIQDIRQQLLNQNS